MRKTFLLICCVAGMTVPLLGTTPVFADDESPAPSAYQQRYGSPFSDMSTSTSRPQAAPVAPTSTPASTSSPIPMATTAISAPVSAGTPPTTAIPSLTYAPDFYSDASSSAYEQRYGAASSSQPTSLTYKRAEFDISTVYDNDPSSNINGGSSFGLDTTVYSATIDNNWRLFAGEFFSHELEPEGEGHINYSRSTSGFEYNNNTIQASLAPTFNVYNGNERVGAAGDMTWTLNDAWAVAGGAQLFSRDIPLRALNAGITANSYDVIADWLQGDSRDVRFTGDAMTFSDDNIRTSLAGSDIEHLYVSKHFTFDGLASVVESQNSLDENRLYFNPKQDVLGLVGGHLGEPLYSRDGIVYDHSLEVKPGVYWQENYGSSPALTATYAQHVNFRNDLDASLGVSFTRQDSDGTAENDLAFLLNLSKKF